MSLTVTNETVSDKFTINNMIHVGISGVDKINYTNCIISAENGQIKVTSEKIFGSIVIYDIKGTLIESAKPNVGNYISGTLAKGIYILKVDGRAY